MEKIFKFSAGLIGFAVLAYVLSILLGVLSNTMFNWAATASNCPEESVDLVVVGKEIIPSWRSSTYRVVLAPAHSESRLSYTVLRNDYDKLEVNDVIRSESVFRRDQDDGTVLYMPRDPHRGFFTTPISDGKSGRLSAEEAEAWISIEIKQNDEVVGGSSAGASSSGLTAGASATGAF